MIGRFTQGMRGPTWTKYASRTAYFAHRGSSFMYPEDTTEAYAQCVARGFDLIEQDVQVLSDGTLCVMHDTTVDRVTTSTGNVSSLNTAGWLALAIDADTWHGSNFGNALVPPLFGAVVDTLKPTSVLIVEPKVTGSGATVVTMLRDKGIRPEAAVIQSFMLAELSDAVTHGYPTVLLSTTGTEDKATVWAAGVRSVCLSDTVSDATFTAWIAYGFRVFAYTVTRRYRRDQLLALGVTGMFTDDVAYTQGSTALRTTDNFASGTWEPGMISQSGSLTDIQRGRFSSSDYWGFPDTADAFVLHGYLSPVASPSSFTLDLKVTFDAVAGGDQTRWANVFIGTTDRPFIDFNDGATCGYTFLMRKTGRMQIYRYDSGVVTASLALQDTAAIADGAEVGYRITVSSTAVSIERTTGTTGTATVNDATYRGGYIFLGKRGCQYRVRDLVVT